MSKTFNMKAACEYLHISRSTMEKLIRKGEIAYSRIGTGRGNYLFLEEDLLDYIKRNKVEPYSVEEAPKENNREMKLEVSVIGE